MNAEDLRQTYNQKWVMSNDLNSPALTDRAVKIATCSLKELKKRGLKNGGKNLLDVGCGVGLYSNAFHKMGYKVTGLDYSDVAVELATKSFPDCKFVKMDGFHPQFNEKFDIIFCKGFSGVNTHDTSFIAAWINRYISLLTDGGFFVLGYASNFTGYEIGKEVANHSMRELEDIIKLVNARYCGMHYFNYFGMISKLKRFVVRKILNSRIKIEYYLSFQKT